MMAVLPSGNLYLFIDFPPPSETLSGSMNGAALAAAGGANLHPRSRCRLGAFEYFISYVGADDGD